MDHYCAFDHKEWDAAGLKDFGEFDWVEFVNERPDGFDQSAGEWYHVDDATLTIYYGSYGNYNSPGASSYTYADVYGEAEREDFAKEVAKWEAFPEFAETGDEDESEDDEPDEEMGEHYLDDESDGE